MLQDRSMFIRQLGDAHIARIEEFSAPTHVPEVLFPELTRDGLAAEAGWLAPDHYVPAVDRLIISIQFWVVRAGGNVIVIDTGVGNMKERGIPRFEKLNNPVLFWLDAAGASREQVTHVVMTHLHVDHVGWNTIWNDGRWEPTFPNARYIMPRQDFAWFDGEYRAGRHSEYGSFPDSVLPIVDAGLATFIDAGDTVADCLVAEAAYGHTAGMVTYRLRSGGEEALFSGDTMHSPLQIRHPDWNDTYALNPDDARKTRWEVLARAADRGALLMPVHFGAPYCGYVRRQGQGFVFEPASW